jgi:hypothetical protein
MLVCLVALSVALATTPQPPLPALPAGMRVVRVQHGVAPHYGIGVMEKVSRKRKLPLVDCMVSSPTEKIGTWMLVTSRKNGHQRLCRVTDVSAPKDKARHIRTGRVIELDWLSAKDLCDLRSVGQEPPRKCPVIVEILENVP